MNDHTTTALVSILIALIGVAAIAVLVGKSNTVGVLGASGSSLSTALCTALSPVTGAKCGNLIENVTSTINFGNIIGG